jgi:hypothetical protein
MDATATVTIIRDMDFRMRDSSEEVTEVAKSRGKQLRQP